MKKLISLLLFFLIFQSVLLEKKSIKRSGKFAKLFEKIKKERSLRKLQGTDSTDQETSEATLPAETPFTPPAENEAESGSALAANGPVPISSPASFKGKKKGNKNAKIQISKFFGFKFPPTGKGEFSFKMLFYFLRMIPKYIIFRLRITYHARLRNLATGDPNTAESVRSNCEISDPNKAGNTPDGGDNVPFECKATSAGDINKANIELNTDVDMVLINNDGTNETISFDDVNFNGNAAEESSNLQAQQGDIKEFKVLKNAVIPTQEGNYLIFRGSSSLESVIRRLDIGAGSEFEMQLVNNGETEPYDCTLTNAGSSPELSCDLSRKSITTSPYLLSPSLGHLKDDNETLLQVELDNPSQEKFTMGSSGSRLTYNKSSSGLSGGAIAGIVIACVVALIAAAVAVIMLKKPSPPVENTTTVANLQTENL